MRPRSKLQLREVHHIRPDRTDEPVIQVMRDGELVATIYGSREGVHIVSERLSGQDRPNRPFFFQSGDLPPGYVVPLLAAEESCPWCEDRGEVRFSETDIRLCPVCQRLS